MYKVKLESRFFVEVALNELDCSRPIVSREWRSTAALAKEPQVFLSLGDALRLVVDGDNLCPFLRVEFFLVRHIYASLICAKFDLFFATMVLTEKLSAKGLRMIVIFLFWEVSIFVPFFIE